jgi:hypothetical protein
MDEPTNLEMAAMRKQILEAMTTPLPPIEGDAVTITREALRSLVAHCRSLEEWKVGDLEEQLGKRFKGEKLEDLMDAVTGNEALREMEWWMKLLDFRKPIPGSLGALCATEDICPRSLGPGRMPLDQYITSRDPIRLEIRHRERKRRGKNKDNVTALSRNQQEETR